MNLCTSCVIQCLQVDSIISFVGRYLGGGVEGILPTLLLATNVTTVALVHILFVQDYSHLTKL